MLVGILIGILVWQLVTFLMWVLLDGTVGEETICLASCGVFALVGMLISEIGNKILKIRRKKRGNNNE